MCLRFNKRPRRMKARRDITVYKHLIDNTDSRFSSMQQACMITSYRYAPVEVDNKTVYKSELVLDKKFLLGNMKVDVGLHSYARKSTAVAEGRGLTEVVVECVIPKGAEYYAGYASCTSHSKKVCGDAYASTELKYVKVIKDFTRRDELWQS